MNYSGGKTEKFEKLSLMSDVCYIFSIGSNFSIFLFVRFLSGSALSKIIINMANFFFTPSYSIFLPLHSSIV